VQQHEAQFEQSVGVWHGAHDCGVQPHVWHEDEDIPSGIEKAITCLHRSLIYFANAVSTLTKSIHPDLMAY
jgi:hypothetical protein